MSLIARNMIVALAALLAPLPAAADPLPRVASTSLCADQFVLGLAAPEQIVSVSWQATGPLSVYADRAEGYPQNRGEAEELLYLDADIVLLASLRIRDTGALLERFGVTVVEIPPVNSFEEIRALTRAVADAIGRPEAGRAAVAEMDAVLAAAEQAAVGEPPLAAYYRPGGGSAGTGTFVDAALTAAGLRNLKAEIGEAGWGSLSLEEVVTHRPDFFVISFFDTAHIGRSITFSRHPLLAELMAEIPVVAVPGRTWVCGGWFLADAVDALTSQRTAGGAIGGEAFRR